jgi:thymidylate synthase
MDKINIKINENKDEYCYLNILSNILKNGCYRKTRNSNTLSIFGVKLDFNIKDTFPLLTTKKVYWKGIAEELLWFIKGDTNSKHLEEKNVNIWKGNSSREFLDNIGLNEYEEGDCGPIYGFQWRYFNTPYIGHNINYQGKGVDQLQNCIDLIKNDPFSRRIFFSAWNPEQIDKMCLPPCHVSYQFYVSHDRGLSCILYQRSGDMFLGVPFNIASVSLLVYLIASITDTYPDKVSLIIGDAHIYEEHIEQVKIQLDRTPYNFPKLNIKNKKTNINDYTYNDFEINDYLCHPVIKAPMIA